MTSLFVMAVLLWLCYGCLYRDEPTDGHLNVFFFFLLPLQTLYRITLKKLFIFVKYIELALLSQKICAFVILVNIAKLPS